MARSTAETLITSLLPDHALGVLTGAMTLLLSDRPLDYSGRLIIQTVPYPSDSAEQIGLENFAALGFSPDDCPVQAFLGWVTIGKIKAYQSDTEFSRDRDRHHRSESLQLLKARSGIQTVYGIELSEPHWLVQPVLEAPGPDEANAFWTPYTSLEKIAAKLVFSKGRKALDINQVMAGK